jgi:putative ABC transport system permease protein
MKIPLTLHNLFDQKLRSFIAVTGIAFAILLVFMQLGFYDSAVRTAILFLDSLDFDVVLISTDYMDINRPGSFPRYRLYQALAVKGVTHGAPVQVGSAYWRIVRKSAPAPSTAEPGGYGTTSFTRAGFQRGLMVVAFPLEAHVFRQDKVPIAREKLTVPGNVLMDTATRDFFGERSEGVTTELSGVQVRVVGQYRIGTGYGADGMVITSDQTFAQIYGSESLRQATLGLIKIKKDANAASVAAAIQSRLDAPEVRVLTRRQILDRESSFWIGKTSIGLIFTLGVVVALTVGAVFLYQVLSTDIGNRFAEYATLKALGYSNLYLSWLVLQQALLYTVVSYFPGLGAAFVLFDLGYQWANLPLEMSWERIWQVLALAVAMASASVLVAVRKVQKADPADLFT